jgi:hypothetical protein
MRYFKQKYTTLDITYSDGKNEVRTFTPTELAAFKRTKQYKTVLSKKVIFGIEMKIKTL